MKKELLQLLKSINRAIDSLATNRLSHKAWNAPYSPATADALQKRLSQELDWMDGDESRSAFVLLMRDLAVGMRSSGVVLSPGYGFLPDSFLMCLGGATAVNPVEWDLPFSRFLHSFHDGCTVPVETGTGGLEAARRVLQNRDELIVETEPGSFQVTFLEGDDIGMVTIRIITYDVLDEFSRTIKNGWRPLDETSLRLFSRGTTDGVIWFEPDKMRELLFEFGPESLSDLVLLNAIFHPDRIPFYPELLKRKLQPNEIPSAGTDRIDHILRESYGLLIYQEQALLLQEIGSPVEIPLNQLALKGHLIGRTMMSVEAMASMRNSSSFKVSN